MSITTYAELKTAITSYIEDSSGAHTSDLGTFISLGEALLFRRLRLRNMVATDTGTLSADTATLALPTRFRGMMRLELSVGDGRVVPVEMDPESAIETYGFWDNNYPRAYTIEGDNLRFWPTPDAAYSYAMAYRQGFQALSDSNTTNSLLADAPDAYLFASLVEAGLKLNSPKTAEWASRLTEAINALNTESKLDSTTGVGTVMPQRGTP